MFKNGEIQGVLFRSLAKHTDQRGWLVEIFRQDEIDPGVYPVMSYISMTNPGIARGPHEHIEQTDLFAFPGLSSFKIYLWDNRKESLTYLNKKVIIVNENEPAFILIPPGVVHCYKNIGNKMGLVANYPNQLFAGKDRKEKVDEIRYESDPNTIFKLE